MDTSLLAQELEPLNAQIELIQDRIETLEGELRIAEAELDAHSVDRKRFDALQDVCNALDSLSELEAGELFWNELPGIKEPDGFVDLLRGQVEKFEENIESGLEKQASLKEQLNKCYDDLGYLDGQVMDAYSREERRRDEFVIEREVTSSPYRKIVMPWSKDGESERYFRRSVLVALLLCIVFGSIIPLVSIPVPERSAMVVEIPERLAMLVRKEPPKPEPVPLPKPQQEEEKVDPEKKKPEQKKPEKAKKKPVEKPTEVAASKGKKKAARKKAENTGVLAFKDTFKDLIDETPVAKLGTEARINNKAPLAAGQARPQRSLVAMQATAGSSGGISNSTVSRNLGAGGTGGNGDRIGGVTFARVESAVADLQEEARPLSDGPGPARTDEEIQIVFDRYKATLYRIYNKELRKDPTLRGKLLLRLSIEPGGEVSMCEVDSTDLASAELVDKILARVKRFNFGEKEDVPQITILYPIDFLPAG
ncbi:MAG TPA: AgmX/PglI C-terminal domain-containing protein [Geopsychrobacteraceae bacterium]|nr:AgmX/PglI C-terminal domain-containing protein [Geopsychrobacteraceae bacterium]